MHPIAARRILYVLLVTLLINAIGWTFNPEAVADVFFAEQDTVSTGMEPPSLQVGHDQEEPVKAKMPCNHWCHAVGHFLGLFGQMPLLSLKSGADYFPQIPSLIPESALEGHFRPPRLSS